MRELEAEATGGSEREGDGGDGFEVRHANVSAASEWYGDVCGSAVRDMNTPGGNVGERMRMYHPRLGR